MVVYDIYKWEKLDKLCGHAICVLWKLFNCADVCIQCIYIQYHKENVYYRQTAPLLIINIIFRYSVSFIILHALWNNGTIYYICLS